MFARIRDKHKCISYWESIDGKYENTIKTSRRHLYAYGSPLSSSINGDVPKKTIKCPNCAITLRIPSDRRVKYKCPSCREKYLNDNEEVTVIIKWTFNARYPTGKLVGTYDIDFVGIENTDKDMWYRLSPTVEWTVSKTIKKSAERRSKEIRCQGLR